MKKIIKLLHNKLVKLLLITLAIALFASGIYIGFRLTKQRHEQLAIIEAENAKQAKQAQELAKKLKLKQAVVAAITQKQELITSEFDLTQTVKWDDSWGSLSLFEKSQDITFYGKGLYIVDLSLVTEEDFAVDDILSTKLLTVTLPKPQIKSIEIIENNTVYSITDTGLLRFGDIKITPYQSQQITSQVKEQMRLTMQEDFYYHQALEHSENSVKDLFQTLLTQSQTEDYIISIKWKP